MENYVDTSYDKKLNAIPFFKIHPSFLPYVGVNYRDAKLKILHIGNCHYIEPSQDPDFKYDFSFFKDKWFAEEIPVLPEAYDLDRQMSKCKTYNKKTQEPSCENAWNQYCLNTRNVVIEQLRDKRDELNLVGKKKYSIYTSTMKMLQETVGNHLFGNNQDEKQIPDLRTEARAYTYIAYTDFHMFPALAHGDGTVKNRLKETAKKEAEEKSHEISKQQIDDFYKKIVDISQEVLNSVIQIIKPDIILITSKEVGNIFSRASEYKDKRFVTAHPNARLTTQEKENNKKAFKTKADEIMKGKE